MPLIIINIKYCFLFLLAPCWFILLLRKIINWNLKKWLYPKTCPINQTNFKFNLALPVFLISKWVVILSQIEVEILITVRVFGFSVTCWITKLKIVNNYSQLEWIELYIDQKAYVLQKRPCLYIKWKVTTLGYEKTNSTNFLTNF